jgi:DnaA family protein
MSQLLLDISPDKLPTLGNFVAGRNIELITVLRQMLNHEGERSFYLWGDSGSGKSHLLQACAHAVSGGQYCQGAVPPMAPLVAVDNVEQLDDAAQLSLFDLYNQVRDGEGVMLVTGTVSPLHLKLRDDLRTRLGWGLVYQLHALNDEEKAQALAQHAQSRNFTLPLDVIQYLLRYGRRDLSSLIAVVNALDEYSLSLHRAPSVPLLKEVLQQELI